jgi:aryl-phospho-beta-D-glucosidase BglC (GH1 family)
MKITQALCGFCICLSLVHNQISDDALLRYDMLGSGINAQGWLTHIHNTNSDNYREYTADDFQLMKELGFDHVRLKVDFAHWWPNLYDSTWCWDVDTTDCPPIFESTDSTIFDYTDEGISYCRDNDLIVVLDYYNWAWDDTMLNSNNYDTSSQYIGKQWRDIANRYKDYHPDSLLYEIYNEPGGIDSLEMRFAFKTIIDSIRTVDTVHTIIVWGQVDTLALLGDENIIPTVHFYEPWIFVNQGKCFGNFPIRTTGIPFPYDSLIFHPDNLLEVDLDTAWIRNQWYDYVYNGYGTVEYVQDWITNRLAYTADSLDMPLYLGEWGATNGAYPEDLLFYLKTVRESFEENNINWALYNWKGGLETDEDYDCSTFTMFDCDNCIFPDSLFTDSTGYSILCALGLDTCSISGDVTEDGILNILDIIYTVNLILNSEFDILSDINNDGFVNVTDITVMVNIILQ